MIPSLAFFLLLFLTIGIWSGRYSRSVYGRGVRVGAKRNPGVFNLVIFAWGAMGSAFGPLAMVYALGGRPTQTVGVAMILTGLAVAVAWRLTGLNTQVYEGAPVVLAGLAVYWAWRLVRRV